MRGKTVQRTSLFAIGKWSSRIISVEITSFSVAQVVVKDHIVGVTSVRVWGPVDESGNGKDEIKGLSPVGIFPTWPKSQVGLTATY